MPVSPQPVLAAIVLASSLGAVVMCLLVLRYGFPSATEEVGDGRRRQIVTSLGHAVAAACFAAAAILAVVLVAGARPQPEDATLAATLTADATNVLDAHVADVTARLTALESRIDAMESRVAPLDGRVAETRDGVPAMAARPGRTAVESRLQEVEALLRRHTDAMARAAARLEHLEEQQVAASSRPASTPETAPVKPRAANSPGSRWIPAGEAPRAPRTAPSPPPPPPVPAPPRTGSASPSRTAAPAAEAALPAHPAPVTPPASPARVTPAPASAGGPPRGRAPSEDEERRTVLAERIRDDWRTVRRGFADAGEDFKRALDSLRHNLRDTLGR